MNAKKRPITVVSVACLYVMVGSFGFIRNLRAIGHADIYWIELTEVLAVVAGVFMLRGLNWAHWLALVWMAFDLALSLTTPHSLVIHSLIFVLIAWLLLRSDAREYFHAG